MSGQAYRDGFSWWNVLLFVVVVVVLVVLWNVVF
jgi:hypothetical protein